MTDFVDQDLRGSRFHKVNLEGAEFRDVTLNSAQLRGVDLVGVRMRGVELVDVEISGELQNVKINGVDIAPLVNAELDARYPDRMKMRPNEPDGFREAWDIVERLWGETVERARRLTPEQLNESVDDEWSFIQTLRHLVFATDSWIRRAILGDPQPWHPLGLPWSESEDVPNIPRDFDARVSLDGALEMRRSRQATVREVLDGLTDELLDSDTKPVDAPGWPPARSFPVRRCLLIILNEEWEHRRYAERDLAILESRDSPDAEHSR
jgi:hypothetical protein